MLPLVFVQVGSPAWYVVGTASLFSAAGMAALTVLNTEVMRRAPRESTGAVSSFRTAASSIGAALGVGLFGTIIISNVQVDAGESDVSAAQLVQLAASLRLVGVLASAVALTGFALLTFADRRSRGQEAELAR
jgi:predicted MFS family arabinose efflux permease